MLNTTLSNTCWVGIGAINALVAVAAGAFGAHGLKSRLTPDMLAIFETGARYQMYHALAMVVVGALLGNESRRSANRFVCALFQSGILFFSGSLYLLALTGQTWLGAITPIGGLAFLMGWALLSWSHLRNKQGQV
ncbi:MAG: DUF423 domain-containing protein [Phycisphaerae bacterium]